MDKFDYNVLKLMNRNQLLDLVPPGFKFHTNPWLHQIASFIAAISAEKFLLALDLGTGKTKVSIDVCRYIEKTFGRVNGIVVCLNSAVEKWVEEIETHSAELNGLAVRGGMKDIISTNYNLRVVSFESLRYICTERIKGVNGKKGYDIINIDAINKILSTCPEVFIIDESHKIKNRESLIFEIIDLLSSGARWRLLLTGTPFHKLIDIWAQYYIMDRGITYGSNFFKFRSDNFINKKVFLKKRGIELPNWTVTPKGKKFIMDMMYTSAIRYDESEVHDMPGKVFEVIKYDLSPEQMQDYIEIIKGIESNKISVKFGENASMTFRQICSGFVLKSKKVYKSNPKLDILEDLLDGIIEKDKIVIFHEFDMEFQLISGLLKRKKINFTAINGSIKDKYSNNKKFMTDDKCRVIVVNLKSGSASIDLQVARYAVFFSNARSVIDRKQAIKRIHRGEIKRTRFYFDLVGRNTIENTIHANMQRGINLFDEVMDRKRFLSVIKGEEKISEAQPKENEQLENKGMAKGAGHGIQRKALLR